MLLREGSLQLREVRMRLQILPRQVISVSSAHSMEGEQVEEDVR